jgi:hypothetical protein
MADAPPDSRPTHERVVVPAGAERGSLARIGPVEEVSGTGLAVVQVGATVSSARAAWERVLSVDSKLAWAAPALVDEQGHERLPTGEVSVRFQQPPSDADLAAFARSHGLVLRGRNEFVPAQVVFVPADRRNTYLPELWTRLAAASGVAAAWANTVSRYRRA